MEANVTHRLWGFVVGFGFVVGCSFASLALPEFLYGMAVACACAVVVMLCGNLLRPRWPLFARGLFFGAVTGLAAAVASIGALIFAVAMNTY